MVKETASYTGSLRERVKLCGVVTQGAEYSRSPDLHNAGYEAMHLNFSYLRFSVPGGQLEQFMDGTRLIPNFKGLSIGTPHKLEVRKFIDESDEVSKRVGAVNTVVIHEDSSGERKYIGTNTDWYGIAKPLSDRMDIRGKNVAVVGAAGAARAAVYAVSEKGGNVTVYNRQDEYAEQLKHDFPDLRIEPLSNLGEISRADAVLHATKIGMNPADATFIDDKYLNPGQVVFDFVYSRDVVHTDLIEKARQKGARIVEGTEMFFWQGTAQFELFTGFKAPIADMKKVLPAHAQW